MYLIDVFIPLCRILFFFPLISGAGKHFNTIFLFKLLLLYEFYYIQNFSTVSYISDKKNGTLDRTLVAGVQTVEILAAYFVTEGGIYFMQLAIC